MTAGISGRIARMAIASMIASATLVGATSTVAHAGGVWQLDDGFDYQPSSTWRIEAYGSSGGGFDLNAGTARTAPNNAFLWAQTQFSAVGRSVTLRNNSSRIDCGAGIFITGLRGAKVNFEIINPSTNTYISLRTVTLSGGGYSQITVPPWRGGPNTVYVRVALLGNGTFNLVRMDDLAVKCSY
jgi:hypothetical protein